MSSMISSKLDEVSRNKVWEEHVHKENRVLQLGDSFQIADAKKREQCMGGVACSKPCPHVLNNEICAAVTVLPEKPNRMVPQQKPSPEAVKAATDLLMSMSVLKDTDKLPHEVYALPRTGNSEYGFFSSTPLVRARMTLVCR